MLEVPRYQIIDAVRGRDGDTRSVRRCLAGNCAQINQKPGKRLVEPAVQDAEGHVVAGDGNCRAVWANASIAPYI